VELTEPGVSQLAPSVSPVAELPQTYCDGSGSRDLRPSTRRFWSLIAFPVAFRNWDLEQEHFGTFWNILEVLTQDLRQDMTRDKPSTAQAMGGMIL